MPDLYFSASCGSRLRPNLRQHIGEFPSRSLTPTLVMPRSFRPVSPNVTIKHAVPPPIPYRYASPVVTRALKFRFLRELASADPRNTIVYFWPTPPLSLINQARRRGFVTVRDMINTSAPSAKAILDEAYHRIGLVPTHHITSSFVDDEHEELNSYDYIFSPNPMVENSLLDMGIDRTKILRSTFGWSPARYDTNTSRKPRDSFRALFVGSICVRKGIPQLLAAWKKSGVRGELLLAGSVEEALKPLLLSIWNKETSDLQDTCPT